MYQVPENSREMALLVELAKEKGIEYVTLGAPPVDQELLKDLRVQEATLREPNHPFLTEDARKKRLHSVRGKIKRLERKLK